MPKLELPQKNYDYALPRLFKILAEGSHYDHVVVDFGEAEILAPGATVAILSATYDWVKQGKKVEYCGLERSKSTRYLQRMNFFQLAGIDLPETFRRFDSTGRFVELKRVDEHEDVSVLSTAVARCVFPELADLDDPEQTGPFDLVEYAASEMSLNARQHARGTGFITAQVYPSTSLVRIGIADAGIGIHRSFEETPPPSWKNEFSDLEALRFALLPRVSSKTHLQGGWGGSQTKANAGVGLSILQELARCAGGIFTLASRTGFYQKDFRRQPASEISLTAPTGFLPGTLCSLELSRNQLRSHQQMLLDAKVALGLMNSSTDIDFENLFS